MSDVSPIPDDYPRVSPSLCVDGAAAAIEFYERVFGGTERLRLEMPDGKIAHAEIVIGDCLVMVSDEFPDWNLLAPPRIGGTPVSLSIYVADVDRVFAAAIAAGAIEAMAVEDQFYGERVGQFIDPFGHKWMVMSRIEDVSQETLKERMAAHFGG